MKKPDVINDEQFSEWCQSQKKCDLSCLKTGTTMKCRIIAQRDDTYEKMLAECESQIQPLKQQLETLRKQADIYYEQIQQAKAEVAREIFGEVKRIAHGTDEHGTHWVRTQREIEEDIESLKDRFLKEEKNELET